jgi:branched-chain amino acid transport system substrate-binding protein
MRSRFAWMFVVVVLFAAACGQKPGVNKLTSGVLPQGATVNEQGQIVDAEGNVIGTTGDLGGGDLGGIATGSGSGSRQTTGGTGAAGDTSADVAAPGEATTQKSASGTATTTGVTNQTIKIGAHAPITGAAPVPSDSAQKGSDLYYKWLRHNNQPINGRFVDSMLKNDNYNPSQAVAVCKEMVEKDRVFLLYGYAGTDQIQACARYSASVGVPYLSAGVTEIGLTTLTNYFAISMSYPQQAPLLADLLVTDLGARKEKNGMLRFDTPNFDDAHDAFIESMGKRGAKVSYDRAVSKGAGQAEAQTVVQEMKAAGLENVYVLTSPVWFLQVLQAARSQSYEPQWVGVGITKALDTVASVGCRNGTLRGAKFFSPFPAWADINKFDPDFQKAVAAVYPEEDKGDDIMIIGWGMSKVIAELLEGAGRQLSREGFIGSAQRAKNVKTGVFPPVTFTSQDHFGGSQVHLNEAQCSGYKSGDNRWHTIRSYVSDF